MDKWLIYIALREGMSGNFAELKYNREFSKNLENHEIFVSFYNVFLFFFLIILIKRILNFNHEK